MVAHMELPQLIQFNANYPGQREIRTGNTLTKSSQERHILALCVHNRQQSIL